MAPHTHEPDPQPLTFTAHPPERRRRRSSVIAAQACCCCCCCCCLHSIGGLVGALVGSLVRVQPTPKEVDPDAEFPFRRDEEDPAFVLPTSFVYWGIFSLASIVAYGLYLFLYASSPPTQDDLITAGVIILLLLPGVQLAASVLALFIVALLPRSIQPDRPAALTRVGFITLWSFVGTFTGIVMMALVLFGLGVLSN